MLLDWPDHYMMVYTLYDGINTDALQDLLGQHGKQVWYWLGGGIWRRSGHIILTLLNDTRGWERIIIPINCPYYYYGCVEASCKRERQQNVPHLPFWNPEPWDQRQIYWLQAREKGPRRRSLLFPVWIIRPTLVDKTSYRQWRYSSLIIVWQFPLHQPPNHCPWCRKIMKEKLSQRSLPPGVRSRVRAIGLQSKFPKLALLCFAFERQKLLKH